MYIPVIFVCGQYGFATRAITQRIVAMVQDNPDATKWAKTEAQATTVKFLLCPEAKRCNFRGSVEMRLHICKAFILRVRFDVIAVWRFPFCVGLLRNPGLWAVLVYVVIFGFKGFGELSQMHSFPGFTNRAIGSGASAPTTVIGKFL